MPSRPRRGLESYVHSPVVVVNRFTREVLAIAKRANLADSKIIGDIDSFVPAGKGLPLQNRLKGSGHRRLHSEGPLRQGRRINVMQPDASRKVPMLMQTIRFIVCLRLVCLSSSSSKKIDNGIICPSGIIGKMSLRSY